MTKHDAITLFGGVSKLASELGITSQAVSLWKDGDLPKRRANEVLGAAIRAGLLDSAPGIAPAPQEHAA